MDQQYWTVRTQDGQDWGAIKRLIIDPTTRQIAFADVVIRGRGGLVRVPWEHFEVVHDVILLRKASGTVLMRVIQDPEPGSPKTVTLDVRTP